MGPAADSPTHNLLFSFGHFLTAVGRGLQLQRWLLPVLPFTVKMGRWTFLLVAAFLLAVAVAAKGEPSPMQSN